MEKKREMDKDKERQLLRIQNEGKEQGAAVKTFKEQYNREIQREEDINRELERQKKQQQKEMDGQKTKREAKQKETGKEESEKQTELERQRKEGDVEDEYLEGNNTEKERKDRSICRRAFNWANGKLKARNNTKIQRTFQRELEEGNQLYITGKAL